MKREAVAAIVGGTLGLCGTVAAFGPRLVNALRLGADGVATDAVVTEVTRKKTCSVAYSFRVDGRGYHGTEDSCPAEVGQSRRVHYLAQDPSVSTLKGPLGAFLYALTPILVVSPWCALTGWMLARRAAGGRPATKKNERQGR